MVALNHSKEGSFVSRRILLLTAVLGLAAALAAFLIPPSLASSSSPTLIADVGPGFTISLKDSSGNVVTQIAPGTYTIRVSDKSDQHNFHLSGPGSVDQKTTVAEVANKTWTVTFVDGSYTYRCDAHPVQMRGTFTVGNPPPPPPPPPKPRVLKGVVGPGFKITLKTKAGKLVRKVKAGKYTIKVRDRSSVDNFHLLGKGVAKKTGVKFVGRKTWKVRFRKGKTYRYRSDPHRKVMKRKFRAV
jgi:plastocyanin